MPRCLGTRGAIWEALRREGEVCLEWAIPRFLHLKCNEAWDWYESPPIPLAGARWHLEVHPDCGGEVGVAIRRDESGPASVTAQVSAGLKGSGERREVEWEFGKGLSRWLFRAPCQRGELAKRGLLPTGALTLTCHVRETGTDSSTQTDSQLEVLSDVKQSTEKRDSFTQTESDLDVPHEVKQSPEKRGGESKALEDFAKLLASGERSDVSVQVGDVEFRVHGAILCARCPALSLSLRHESRERASGRIVVEDCQPDAFGGFLHYLYTGSVRPLSEHDAFGLYRIADRYLADDLKQLCLEHMRNTLSIQTFCDAVRLALTHGEGDLLQRATDFAVENIQLILPTVEWQHFIRDCPTEANEILIRCFCPRS